MSYLIGLGVLVVLGVGVYFYLKKHPSNDAPLVTGPGKKDFEPKG